MINDPSESQKEHSQVHHEHFQEGAIGQLIEQEIAKSKIEADQKKLETRVLNVVETKVEPQEKVKESQKLNKVLAKVDQEVALLHSSVKKGKSSSFELEFEEKHYSFWKKYFGSKEKERFKRFLENGSRYEKIVKAVFKKHGLPEDLYYVGVIESGYQTHARSHASAVGPWQFIRGTARRYGLTVNRHLDERKSIYKSTEAAAKYFKDLYNIFGSWELALCSYNAGEYRIINAIRKGNTRSYKELVRKKLIPKETVFYIPKVAAARDLANQGKVAFKKNKKEASFYEKGRIIEFSGRVNGKKIAQKAKISYHDFRKYNPDWKYQHISGSYSVVVPENAYKTASTYLKKASSRRSSTRAIASHSVRRGENLTLIARKYGLSIRELKRINRIRGSRIYIGQKLKVSKKSYHYYTVRRGDSLYRIAKKYNTSIKYLMAMNKIRGENIYPNQKIKVPL